MRSGANRAKQPEYFWDQGKNVLLIMDSLTGLLMQKEKLDCHLMPPQGYPPSAFYDPNLIEEQNK